MNINDIINIKGLRAFNRLVMPPMATKRAVEGRVSEELCQFYTERCGSGHIGLVITEHSYISPEGQASERQLSVADDSCIDGLHILTDRIKRSGSLVFCQLSHAGKKAKRSVTGLSPVSPWAEPGEDCNTLKKDEIRRLTELFAAAALRAKKAGYDGVELHSAHGYLMNQFYSPLINKRQDEYGPQSLENRLRFHRETISAVRAAVGNSFPIAVRLGGCDYTPGGSSIEDAAEASLMLQNYGADLMDISGGIYGYTVTGREKSYFEDMGREVKKKLSIPVIITGGICSGSEANRLIESGAADMTGVGRALIADPQWPEKNLL